MSNYLSKLARASGLGYEPRPPLPRVPVGAFHAGGGEPATHDPPHAEQVTFVEQVARAPRLEESSGHARGEVTGEGRGDARARRVEESGGFAREARASDVPSDAAVRAQSFAAGDVRPTPRPGEGRVRLDGPDAAGRRAKALDESRSVEDAAVLSADRAETLSESRETPPRAARPAREQLPEQTHASKEESVHVSTRVEADAQSAGPRSAPLDAERAESRGTEEARPTYLREIIEWVSAPPEPRAEDGAREGGSPFEWARGQSGVGGSEEAAHGRAEAERGPEVEDFTLSIGSIHVVVEEPPGQPQTRPAAPAPSTSSSSRGRGFGASDGGGSRLRRHYIRV